MKIRAALSLFVLFAMTAFGFSSAAYAGSKVDVCHLTSSATNPSVLINVSVSAQRAHLDHGDPLTFTVLPGGKCARLDGPPPPPPPTPAVLLCGLTSIGGGPDALFADYYPDTGVITFDYGTDADTSVDFEGQIVGKGDPLSSGKVMDLDNELSLASEAFGTAGAAYWFTGGVVALTTNANCASLGLQAR